jgi:hypothetical protein
LVAAVRASVPNGRGYAVADSRPGFPCHVEAGFSSASPDVPRGAEEYDVVVLFEARPPTTWLSLYLDETPPRGRDVAYCSIMSPEGELEDVLKPVILSDKTGSRERYEQELRDYAHSTAEYLRSRTSMIVDFLRDRSPN